MVSKPTILPEWAENDVVDPISGQNNVLEPPPEKKLEGWARLEYPPRNWFNWLARYTWRWLNWLNQQEEQSIVTASRIAGKIKELCEQLAQLDPLEYEKIFTGPI